MYAKSDKEFDFGRFGLRFAGSKGQILQYHIAHEGDIKGLCPVDFFLLQYSLVGRLDHIEAPNAE